MKPEFMTREQFDELVTKKMIKPDALFPILNYDICKRVWETSPLIAAMIEAFEDSK